MRSDRSLVREGNQTVLTLNPDAYEGMRAAVESNQIMLAMRYVSDIIEELNKRVKELEAEKTVVKPTATRGRAKTEPEG